MTAKLEGVTVSIRGSIIGVLIIRKRQAIPSICISL